MVDKNVIKAVRLGLLSVWAILILMGLALVFFMNPSLFTPSTPKEIPVKKEAWVAPDSVAINTLPNAELILYGRELIVHTAVYLGPQGSVSSTTNGMNCQNCHLKGGKKFFGNNYSAVASMYPKKRARSGTVENIEKRINDCIERSLNGEVLSVESRELKSMAAYILWVGSEVPKGETPEGAKIPKLSYLDRAADPVLGEKVFKTNCVRCHGEDGLGIKAENGLEWKYPPLHGEYSFNVGAGLFRISTFAGFVKLNMPNDLTSYGKPLLSDEEAWDVAAYIVSLPRPIKVFPNDWPDLSQKPIDHPFGPYADSFSEQEHKYGPFGKMIK